MEKTAILNALDRFVAQRPGLDPRNYGDGSSYRAEYREILRDKHHAEALLRAVAWRDAITAERLLAASKHSFSGRLSIDAQPNGAVRVDYCTGQYFPTEYRRAVCAVLSSALWDYFRNGCGCKTGDDIRRMAGRELGATIARRWFR